MKDKKEPLRHFDKVPKFKLEGDATLLDEPCGHTVSFIRVNFFLAETSARQAMQYAQQKHECKVQVSIEDLNARWPVLKECGANPKDIKELITSSPGSPDARKWTTSLFSRNLQMTPQTVLRYARTDGEKPSK